MEIQLAAKKKVDAGNNTEKKEGETNTTKDVASATQVNGPVQVDSPVPLQKGRNTNGNGVVPEKESEKEPEKKVVEANHTS